MSQPHFLYRPERGTTHWTATLMPSGFIRLRPQGDDRGSVIEITRDTAEQIVAALANIEGA